MVSWSQKVVLSEWSDYPPPSVSEAWSTDLLSVRSRQVPDTTANRSNWCSVSRHSESITHVISENNSGNEVRTWLDSRDPGRVRAPVQLLDVSWYTESMRAGRPVQILDRHKLQVRSTSCSLSYIKGVRTIKDKLRSSNNSESVKLTSNNVEFSRDEP